MPALLHDCPRCDAQRMTFDVMYAHIVGQKYGWQNWYEAFSICRRCERGTTFILSERTDSDYNYIHRQGLLNVDVAVNRYVNVETYVSIRDQASVSPPEHVPERISAIFREGATCLQMQCFNAAGAMFRLCIDMATRELLPADDEITLKRSQRRNLGPRLGWLFDNGKINEELRDLSDAVKEDGDDGVHLGSLGEIEAQDLLDFTDALLDRIYTQPKRIADAKERRGKRRSDG